MKVVDNPAVSIIVPVYNVEKYLRQCLDSIIDQTYRNLQIILIDDGSPDNCGVICDQYAVQDNRIHVIHQSNRGLSAARNAGLDIATGEYIAFVDSDDWISQNAIQRMMDTYESTEAELVICNMELYQENECTGNGNRSTPMKDSYLTQQQMIERLCMNSCWYYRVVWNKLYRRETFQGLRFPVGYIHEDEAIFHHVIGRCKRIAVIEEKLYIYRQRDSSIMGTGFSGRSTDLLYGLSDRLVCARNHGWREYEKLTVLYYEEKFWEWYHLLHGNVEDATYVKRMERGVRYALPSILKCREILISHKVYLSMICVSPSLFWAVYGTIGKKRQGRVEGKNRRN